MSAEARYVPSPEGLNLELHRAAVAAGRLHLQRCSDCGVYRHPPRYYCAACGSPGYEMVPSEERGTVHSLVVTHRSFDPGWAPDAPHATVAVELDEGPRVIGALRGDDPHTVRIGDRVRVSVEPRGDDFAFVWVDPDASA